MDNKKIPGSTAQVIAKIYSTETPILPVGISGSLGRVTKLLHKPKKKSGKPSTLSKHLKIS